VIGVTRGELIINDVSDIVVVRKTVHQAAASLNFSLSDITRIVTAASELARNVYLYAGSGKVVWQTIDDAGMTGIQLTFEDHGPGIRDLEKAMQEGWSTSGGLGLGLPGTRRLMDEMEIDTGGDNGTTIVIKKWRRRN
jgi:serine/threonine-protein kinase RsbT